MEGEKEGQRRITLAPMSTRASDSSRIAASFRDPGGRVLVHRGRLFRIVHPSGVEDARAFLESPAGHALLENGCVAATRALDETETAALLEDEPVSAAAGGLAIAAIFEHERIWFPSYPYEWPAEMLHAAAGLTLDLAVRLLPDAVGLKDGTPYNVLFRGPRPVFVDLLSFERRSPDDPVWLAYGQFVRTFVLPLLAWRKLRMPAGPILLARRDGLEPDEIYGWLGPLDRLLPPALTLVSVPKWLSRRADSPDAYRARHIGDPEKARFILASLFRGLRRALGRLEPCAGPSTWSDYMQTKSHYTAERFVAKEEFVRDALAAASPGAVLDVGCNTGHFSEIAAGHGARVVAIDYDPVVAGQVWRRASAGGLDILPLVVNLARPTPATGWRNEEGASFLDRARGQFDLVLMLAVLHHMLVTERVPLEDILDVAAELTRRWLVIEYVDPSDPMFRRITRGRDALHAELTPERFEAACARRFEIVRAGSQGGPTRRMYLLAKKQEA